jgi:hypothetical protein
VLLAFRAVQVVQKVLVFLEFQGIQQGSVDMLVEEVGMVGLAVLVDRVVQHVLLVRGDLAVRVVLGVLVDQVRLKK